MIKKLALISFIIIAFQYPDSYCQGEEYFFSFDFKKLQSIREEFRQGACRQEKEVKHVIRQAEKALKQKTLSVMEKDIVPPSGDKHDYTSQAPYFWPDPDKPDGLPYISKDGETNPERDEIPDGRNFNRLRHSVSELALGYFFTNDEKYLKHAVALLKTWFINEETKMYPNLKYAQFVKGSDKLRWGGIIDLRYIYYITDAINIFRQAGVFPQEDNIKIIKWLESYLKWLTESTQGIRESNSKNNHGTWYDVQVVAISSFLGKCTMMDSVLERVKDKRIATQIEPDGSQPLELKRTKSIHYSVFNLEAFQLLGSYGKQRGVDIWNYRTIDNRSIKQAFEYMMPFLTEEKAWENKQIVKYEPGSIYYLFSDAGAEMKEELYKKVAAGFYDKRKIIFTSEILTK